MLKASATDRGFAIDVEEVQKMLGNIAGAMELKKVQGSSMTAIRAAALKIQPAMARYRSIVSNASKGFQEQYKANLDMMRGNVEQAVRKLISEQDTKFWAGMAPSLASVMSHLGGDIAKPDFEKLINDLSAPNLAAALASTSASSIDVLLDAPQIKDQDSKLGYMAEFLSSTLAFVKAAFSDGRLEVGIGKGESAKFFTMAAFVIKSNLCADEDVIGDITSVLTTFREAAVAFVDVQPSSTSRTSCHWWRRRSRQVVVGSLGSASGRQVGRPFIPLSRKIAVVASPGELEFRVSLRSFNLCSRIAVVFRRSSCRAMGLP